jgi:hypothetical protein
VATQRSDRGGPHLIEYRGASAGTKAPQASDQGDKQRRRVAIFRTQAQP